MPGQFPAYEHHICIVSAHNVPELLGALLADPKPHVHAVVSAQMADRGAWLASALRKRGAPVSIHDLEAPSMPAIMTLLNKIRAAGGEGRWAVNMTGGTKLMSLGAFAWAAKNGIAAFYVDTAAKRVELYDEGQWRSLPLPPILRYEPLLNVYGYEIKGNAGGPPPKKLGAALNKLADLAGRPGAPEAYSQLNKLAGDALHANLTAACAPQGLLIQILETCRMAGKLDWGAGKVHFRNEHDADWCRGLWLENYTHMILAELGAGGRIKSLASGVKVDAGGAGQELDAVFTVNNKLHVLECKTGPLKDVSVLYKADSVRARVGGLFGKFMLCSVDALGPGQAARAEDMKLTAVTGPKLKNLRNILLEWIDA